MPVHDWTRVVAGNFHDFHQRWAVALSDALNDGLLPPDHYAMVEQATAEGRPDLITLERADAGPEFLEISPGPGLLAVAEAPPKVRFIDYGDVDAYAALASRVAVRHASGDRTVAIAEIVSRGNKSDRAALDEFVDKLNEVFHAELHLLVLDILPPGRFDPEGVYAAFWQSHADGPVHAVTVDEPFGVASYRAGPSPTAYFERVSLGKLLPDMPLFLTPEHYVNVPLEATYMAAWRGVPRRWKEVLEGTST